MGGLGKGLRAGRLVRFRVLVCVGLLVAVVFALSSCSTEQGGPTNGEDAEPPTREVTREVTKMVTVAEAPEDEENAASPPSTPPADRPDERPATQQGSPEEVLALQYRLINAGDYEGAYALFDDRSKLLITPEQYAAYFEANAPYAITDYSFLSVDDRGDDASVEAELTASSGSGQETYAVTQPLVREGAAWRVVMRDEQASTFAGAEQETAQYEPESTSQSEGDSAPPSEGDSAGFGDGTYQVGSDVQPGTYRTRESSPGCYYARLGGFSGEFEDLLANGNPTGPAIVTIEPTDAGFESQRCGTWTGDLSAITESKTSFDEGTYIVGTDIEPGTYRNSGSSGCYYARLAGFTGDFENIIANGNTDASTVVTIAPTDAGFESQRCGTWTRVE